MGALKTEAIILRSQHFFEKDKRLELFSPKLGRFSALAKGAMGSRRGGRLQAANYVDVLVHKGRSFYILRECQVLDMHSNLREDLARIGLAIYFMDIIRKATADEQRNAPLFELLKRSLSALCSEGEPEETKSDFQTAFLALEGLGGGGDFEVIFEEYSGRSLARRI